MCADAPRSSSAAARWRCARPSCWCRPARCRAWWRRPSCPRSRSWPSAMAAAAKPCPSRRGHLDGAALVIVATGVTGVDAAVHREAGARGVPVNVADRPELCTFILPAVVDRSPVIVAFSTGGRVAGAGAQPAGAAGGHAAGRARAARGLPRRQARLAARARARSRPAAARLGAAAGGGGGRTRAGGRRGRRGAPAAAKRGRRSAPRRAARSTWSAPVPAIRTCSASARCA